MHAPVLQIGDGELQFRAVRAQEAERDLCGLLHHVAQLAGEGQSGGTRLRVGERGLDEQHVSARAGHRQARGHAGDGGAPLGRVLRGLRDVVRPADEGPQVVGADPQGQLLLAELVLRGHLAQQPGDGPLQGAHARLAGVLAGQLAQGVLLQDHLVGGQTGALQLPGQQVVAGDDDLLVLGVAVEADELHAVGEGLRDGLQHVRRGQEDDVAEVELDLQVVVAEGVVLGRVQDLQQGGGRVPAEVGADLVDLVEEDDRVHRASLLDGAHDPAGQRSHVRPAVAADLGLVPYAAEGDPDELAAHRVRDGLAEGGLADAGRADEGEDGPAAAAADDAHPALGAALAHGQVLGDAVLHVAEPGVLGVEDGAGAEDVVLVLGPLVPGQFEHRVQPGADPGALRRLIAGALQLLDFLERRVPYLLGEVGGLDPGPVVVGGLALLLPVQLAQFLAHGLQLAAQQELSLLLLDAVLDVLGDGLGDVLLGQVVAQPGDGQLEAGDGVGGLQQLHLLSHGQERRVAGVVGEGGDALDLLDAVHDLPGAALLQPAGGEGLVLLDELGDGSGQRIGQPLVDALALDPEGGPGAGGPGPDADAADTADEGPGVPVGEPPHLLDGPQHTGAGVLAVDPRHEQHPGLAGPDRGLGGLHGPPHLGVGQVQRHDHPRQHDLVVERQHGQGERYGRRSHDLPSGSEVELCRLNACAPPGVPQPPFACGEHAPTAGLSTGQPVGVMPMSPDEVRTEIRDGAAGSEGRVASCLPELVAVASRYGADGTRMVTSPELVCADTSAGGFVKSRRTSPEEAVASALGPARPAAVTEPDEVRAFSGPAMPSALTAPDEDVRSAAATPVAVIRPLLVVSLTAAAAGTSRR